MFIIMAKVIKGGHDYDKLEGGCEIEFEPGILDKFLPYSFDARVDTVQYS